MTESENRKALKSGMWYVVGNVLLKGIGFLTTPIFSRLMSQENIGDFSNLITWIGIISIIFTFDLYSSIAIARFDFRDELNSYISSILGLGSLITLGFFLVIYPFRYSILHYLGLSEYVYYLAFAYMIFYPAIQIFQSKSQVQYKYKASLGISLSTAIISSLLSILFVTFFKDKLSGRIWGHFMPFIVAGLIIYLWYWVHNKPSTKYWKYALNISSPLIFHLLAGYILSSSDRAMIHALSGSRAAGLYSVAYSCAMIINVLMSSMNSAWVPWSMAQIDGGNTSELRRKAKLFVSLFGILSFGIVLLGPEVLLIMGGKSYMEAKYVIPPVMIGIVFQFIYTLYVNIEQYFKKQKIVAIGTVIAAIINILLNRFLIPVYGYVAAAYTTLLSYIILFSIHFLFVRKMGKNNIYDSKFNICFLIASIFFLFISLTLYNSDIIRIGIIVILIIILLTIIIKQKDIFLQAVKTRQLKPIINAVNDRKILAKRSMQQVDSEKK